MNRFYYWTWILWTWKYSTACACMRGQWPSHARMFMTPQTTVYQALLSIGFSRQECWNGLPFPPPTIAWELFKSWLCWIGSWCFSGLLYPSTFLCIMLIFAHLILKLKLKFLIYLPKIRIIICSVFSKSPVNVLSYFHNLKNKKERKIFFWCL